MLKKENKHLQEQKERVLDITKEFEELITLKK